MKNQVFAEIVHPSKSFFTHAYFDGIIGMALPALARPETVPFFDNLMIQAGLKHNTFSFYFDRTHNYSKSFMLIGEPDTRFAAGGKIDYHPVVSNKYWEVRLDKILVNGKETSLCVHGCTAIMDTGSSIISGPSASIYDLLSR